MYEVSKGILDDDCEVAVASLVVVIIELGESTDVLGEAVLLDRLAEVPDVASEASWR